MRWRVWVASNALVVIGALQLKAVPVFFTPLPHVKRVFGTSFFPVPALQVDVVRGPTCG
jgi:hypothetical protein